MNGVDTYVDNLLAYFPNVKNQSVREWHTQIPFQWLCYIGGGLLGLQTTCLLLALFQLVSHRAELSWQEMATKVGGPVILCYLIPAVGLKLKKYRRFKLTRRAYCRLDCNERVVLGYLVKK